MTERAYAQCPECSGDTFRLVDEDTEGAWPDCRLICTKCYRVWKQMELKGIEYADVPF